MKLNLTYDDVFLIPSYSEVESRLQVDLTTRDGVGTTLPIVVANMNAVAGKRMAETVARRGGVAILSQDLPFNLIEKTVKYVKSRSSNYDTALTLLEDNTVIEAYNIIYKRAHGGIVVVDKKEQPMGVFLEGDGEGRDQFTHLWELIKDKQLVTIGEDFTSEEAFLLMRKNNLKILPVVKEGQLKGVLTQKGALRNSIYRPAIDNKGRLLVAAALGVNGDVGGRAEKLLELGVDVLVIDTAHGFQKKMLTAIAEVRRVSGEVTIVAGNVVTKEATRSLLQAGADIIKVGIGPGAMCTTRMMTGVGRPQFSAVKECAGVASKMGGSVWADGGIKHPRDVALALAAGASSVCIGSWFAGTCESPGDVKRDSDGRLYKENYGMASRRAVRGRSEGRSLFEQSKRELFEEGISQSRLYIDPERPGVEDIIDQIVAGLRSAMTYAGANNIEEFQEKARIGRQSAAGYQEGRPVEESW